MPKKLSNKILSDLIARQLYQLNYFITNFYLERCNA